MSETISPIYHNTPPGRYRHLLHSVVLAGHHRVAPGYELRSQLTPRHHLILSTSGSILVRVEHRCFAIEPGQLAWIDNGGYRAVGWPERPGPSEMYWMCLDSGHIDALAQDLDVAANPLFVLPDTGKVIGIFRAIFELMQTRPVAVDAALNAQMATLLAVLFEVRLSAASTERHTTAGAGRAAGLSHVLSIMRSDHCRRWTVPKLARLMGLSRQQFFRRFRQATGSSPMDWLRRERINHAKRLLTESSDLIDSVAASVGYADAHYFSRDFKKVVGMSPRQYRQWEQVMRARE